MLKRAYRAIVPERVRRRIAPFLQQGRNLDALTRKYGQFASMLRRSCVDASGDAIPWYTYPAIEFLQNLHTERLSLFEYGSGNSTIWWTRRVARVVSVEHDPAWHAQVAAQTRTAANLEYVLSDRDGYGAQIGRYAKEFDIIAIDGICRPGCAQHALANIRRFGGTIVILDNADWYPVLTAYLTRELGWSRADMNGFGPINDYTWTTSMWINQERVVGLYRDRMLYSVAAVRQQYEEDYDFSLRIADRMSPDRQEASVDEQA
jgi:hypothetical protein